MSELAHQIQEFATSVSTGCTEVYNEFSLQHELGMFLRQRMPTFKVRFERNVSFYFPSAASFSKREIDISVFLPDTNYLRYAIELKYPRNGQYPEQMFSFCKDIAFAEELNLAGFCSTAVLILAEDPLFYRGPSEGIYGFFRGQRPLHGLIRKPTGTKDAVVNVVGTYIVQWKPISNPLMYALIEIGASG
jgi:hypothetical protein